MTNYSGLVDKHLPDKRYGYISYHDPAPNVDILIYFSHKKKAWPEIKKGQSVRFSKNTDATGRSVAVNITIGKSHYSEEKKRIVLCGYSWLLKPRLIVLFMPDSGNLKEIKEGR